MSELFVLDANSFIQPKRRFYPFDVCPGYWKILNNFKERGTLISIDKVRDEIERGGDDLWDYIRSTFGEQNFAATNSFEIQQRYSEMIIWVNAQPQFSQQAREEFALHDVADGWLAACAKTLPRGVIVTLEVHQPNARRKVPLPNVCAAFDIECISPFEMLRRLGVKLDWNP